MNKGLTVPKLQDIKNYPVIVKTFGKLLNGGYEGYIKRKGKDGGEILIRSHATFNTKKEAIETMEKVVTLIKGIKVDLTKGELPIETLCEIRCLLHNETLPDKK